MNIRFIFILYIHYIIVYPEVLEDWGDCLCVSFFFGGGGVFQLFSTWNVIWLEDYDNNSEDLWHLFRENISHDFPVFGDFFMLMDNKSACRTPWDLELRLNNTRLTRNIILQACTFGFHLIFRGCKMHHLSVDFGGRFGPRVRGGKVEGNIL